MFARMLLKLQIYICMYTCIHMYAYDIYEEICISIFWNAFFPDFTWFIRDSRDVTCSGVCLGAFEASVVPLAQAHLT